MWKILLLQRAKAQEIMHVVHTMSEDPDIRKCEGGLCLLFRGVWQLCPKHYGLAMREANKPAKGKP